MDFAADRKTRIDAVRFDLRAALKGRKTVFCCLPERDGKGSNTLNSTWSTSAVDLKDRGWSGSSPGGEGRGSSDLRGCRHFLLLGVIGLSYEGIVLALSESPREGRLSNEPGRDDKVDVKTLSEMDASSSPSSSGGLNSTSNGLRLKEDRLEGVKHSSWLRSFSDTCDRGTIESTVMRASLR